MVSLLSGCRWARLSVHLPRPLPLRHRPRGDLADHTGLDSLGRQLDELPGKITDDAAK